MQVTGIAVPAKVPCGKSGRPAWLAPADSPGRAVRPYSMRTSGSLGDSPGRSPGSRAIQASAVVAVPVTLVLAARDQTPTASPRRRATVKPAQVMETRRETDGKPAPGDGRRVRTETAGRRETRGRTPDAGKPEDGGRRGRTRRANGKPEESPPGTSEAVRSGPKPPGESPGIWGRTHRQSWPGSTTCTGFSRVPGPVGPSDARPRAGQGYGVCRRSGISPPHREAGRVCQRGAMPTWSRGSAVRSPRWAGSGSRMGAARR